MVNLSRVGASRARIAATITLVWVLAMHRRILSEELLHFSRPARSVMALSSESFYPISSPLFSSSNLALPGCSSLLCFCKDSFSASALLASPRLALAGEPTEGVVSVGVLALSATDEDCVCGGAEAPGERWVVLMLAERVVSVGVLAPSVTDQGCVCGGTEAPARRWFVLLPSGSALAGGGGAVARGGVLIFLDRASYYMCFVASCCMASAALWREATSVPKTMVK